MTKYKKNSKIKILLYSNIFLILLNFTAAKEEQIKSRILIKKEPLLEKKSYKKIKSDIKENEKQNINLEKKQNKNVTILKKNKENRGIQLNKSMDLDANSFRIYYAPNQVELYDSGFEEFVRNISSHNKNTKVNIFAYASREKDKTTSDARRLSLSRALLIREILINNQFLSTNIYVRAMGSEDSTEYNKDVVVIEIN